MTIEVQLDESQLARLKTLAEGKGVTAESLVQQIVVDMLDQSDDEAFDRLIKRVISRNDELYRRLA